MLEIKYIGIAVIIISVDFIRRCLMERIVRARLECFEALTLVKQLRIQLSCYMKSEIEVCLCADIPCLSEAGFLKEVSSLGNIKEAFMKIMDKLLMPAEAKEMLLNMFSSFGTGYLNEELDVIVATEKRLSDLCDSVIEEEKKKSKLYFAISTALSLGTTLILI